MHNSSLACPFGQAQGKYREREGAGMGEGFGGVGAVLGNPP